MVCTKNKPAVVVLEALVLFLMSFDLMPLAADLASWTRSEESMDLWETLEANEMASSLSLSSPRLCWKQKHTIKSGLYTIALPETLNPGEKTRALCLVNSECDENQTPD